MATQHRTAEHSRTTAGQLQRDPQTTILLLSCSQACPTIVASPTNAHVHQGVAQHIDLILECADASIDNTLADPPDCPKAPCPSFSSMNDGLTASPLACLSRNQQSSNVLSSHRGTHGHTRDLMTSLGPCKSKTADPTSRALGGGGGEELRSWRDSKMQPAASSQLLPPSSEGASQGRGSERCHRIRAAQDKLSNPAYQPGRAVCEGERQGKVTDFHLMPVVASTHRFVIGLILEPPFCFLFVRSFIIFLSSFLLSQSSRLYASSKTCLTEIVKLVMQVSPSILHGLWGPLQRMADGLQITATLLLFPPISDLPVPSCATVIFSPLLICSPNPGVTLAE